MAAPVAGLKPRPGELHRQPVWHHAPVPCRRARLAVVAALSIRLPRLVAGVLVLCLAPALARADLLSAVVSAQGAGWPMPQGFLGVSVEYPALHAYTGSDPRAIDPALLGLLRGLSDGGPPVIRVGGDSTDSSFVPTRAAAGGGGLSYRITPDWLRTTGALAADLDARLILGINLAASSAAIAAAEGRALVRAIGVGHIAALEIGNEPDLYGTFPWYVDARGRVHRARARSFSLADYEQQFRRWAAVLPRVPLAGPALSGPAWMRGLSAFVARAPRLAIVTYHRYPLRACQRNPRAAGYPSIPNLLAARSSAALAAGLAGYVRIAHRRGLQFRVDELNSASCEGARGVSDTFASALWALNTLFELASVGVDGVNFHTLPGAAYELFGVSRTPRGVWQASVRPEYYGLEMFAQAFPPGARLETVRGPGGPVSVWATLAPDGTERVTLINEDPLAEHNVAVAIGQAQAPGGSGQAPTGSGQAPGGSGQAPASSGQAPGGSGGAPLGALELLLAPSLRSTTGVTLGGQTFGAQTETGVLPPPQTYPVAPTGDVYTVSMPPASAALLTIPAASGQATPQTPVR